MATGGGGAPSGGVWPKILLAKPAHGNAASAPAGGVVKLMRDEEGAASRSRLSHGSLNIMTDSWDFYPDRLMSLMSDNTDFTVVGVLGLPGAGKSTILNELYGFDGTISGVLPPFPVQSEETKVMARHCTAGMELRVSPERLILLDTQPIYSSSVLMDMTRPDGSSTLQLLSGESISAELAHELMGLQLGVFLTSVCHVVLVVTDGLDDMTLWKLMQTVEMLSHGIPDPSAVTSGGQLSASADDIITQETQSEFFADVVFIHTKLRENELTYSSIEDLKTSLYKYFVSSEFRKNGAVGYVPPQVAVQAEAKATNISEKASAVNFFLLPKCQYDCTRKQLESPSLVLRQLRDQILSMPRRSFVKPINERDWLRNASRVWDLVKKSTVISDYGKMLQSSGLFRR